MVHTSRQPIDLGPLSDVGQLAVSLLTAVHVETPVQAMRSQLEQIPASAVADVEGALLILVRLLQDRAARRAASRAAQGETVTLSARMTREIGDSLGGEARVKLITADLEELLVAWGADDRSVEPLAERYARRWAQDGLHQLALTTAALLPAGDAAWEDLGWAVHQLIELEGHRRR